MTEKGAWNKVREGGEVRERRGEDEETRMHLIDADDALLDFGGLENVSHNGEERLGRPTNGFQGRHDFDSIGRGDGEGTAIAPVRISTAMMSAGGKETERTKRKGERIGKCNGV